jgi:hypothetical protein
MMIAVALFDASMLRVHERTAAAFTKRMKTTRREVHRSIVVRKRVVLVYTTTTDEESSGGRGRGGAPSQGVTARAC